MEKKEPILTAGNSQREEEAGSPASSYLKEKKQRGSGGRLSDKQRKFLLAFLICLVIVGITIWAVSFFGQDSANEATIDAPRAAASAAPAETGPSGSWWSRLFGKSGDEKSEPVAPSITIARMEKGTLVISGEANKGDVVHILENGREIGTEKADGNGQWAFVSDTAVAPGNKKFSLYVEGKDGGRLVSRQSAVLHVSKEGSDEVAVIMGGKEKSKVLNAPKGQDIGALRIDKIDYAEDGDFRAEGRALKGSTINLYLDGKLLAKTAAGGDGAWSVGADAKLGGKRHAVRADMLDAKGKVARRVEYRFEPAFVEGSGSAVMVKRGDCLWNIALKEYGNGTSYVVLFEANRTQIKNPDLIYPGQAFSVPKKDSGRFKELRRGYKPRGGKPE